MWELSKRCWNLISVLFQVWSFFQFSLKITATRSRSCKQGFQESRIIWRKNSKEKKVYTWCFNSKNSQTTFYASCYSLIEITSHIIDEKERVRSFCPLPVLADTRCSVMVFFTCISRSGQAFGCICVSVAGGPQAEIANSASPALINTL